MIKKLGVKIQDLEDFLVRFAILYEYLQSFEDLCDLSLNWCLEDVFKDCEELWRPKGDGDLKNQDPKRLEKKSRTETLETSHEGIKGRTWSWLRRISSPVFPFLSCFDLFLLF